MKDVKFTGEGQSRYCGQHDDGAIEIIGLDQFT